METGPLEGMNLGRMLRGEEWYALLLRGKSGALYVDVASSPEERVQKHNIDDKPQPWVRTARPFIIAWQSPAMDQPRALRLAVELKKMPRKQKLAFIKKGEVDVATI